MEHMFLLIAIGLHPVVKHRIVLLILVNPLAVSQPDCPYVLTVNTIVRYLATTVTIREFDKRLKAQGTTAMEIAALLNISRSAISKWRSRKAVPAKFHGLLLQVLDTPYNPDYAAAILNFFNKR